jgi:hypothetical protein
MEMMLTGVDLVYDATGEPGLQYPSFHGGSGAGSCRISASQGRTALGAGSSRASITERAAAAGGAFKPRSTIRFRHLGGSSGGIQPAGCSSVTYTGANFDMMEVALQGVRLATVTLLARRGVATTTIGMSRVVNLRDADGRRIEPRWTVYTLERNPACPVCH